MPEQTTTYREGQTATNPRTGQRVVFRNGMWVNDTSSSTQARPQQRARTTSADQKAVQEGSALAQTERDTQRIYSQAEAAVNRLDTGPMQSWWMDAITPEPDGSGGILDSIGGVLGTPFRHLGYNSQDWADRDQLNTVNANAAIAAAANMKGAASDRDMALMRLTGLQTGKTAAENNRIISEARRQSYLNQWRARYRAQWVTRYGSLSAPAPSGASFEEALQAGERAFNNRWEERSEQAGRPSASRQPAQGRRVTRAAPPSTRRRSQSSAPVTIDLNGNPIR